MVADVSDGTSTINFPVTISLNPVDEGSPVFVNKFVEISEISKPGDLVTYFTATDVDNDFNDIEAYEIFAGNSEEKFIINPKTGKVVLSKYVDYDNGTREYVLFIRAYDGTNYGYGNLTIKILDYNDNVPTCSKNIFINKNLLENSTSGSLVIDLSSCADIDHGIFGEFDFSMTGDSGKFQIANKSLRTFGNLDYETTQSHEIVIKMIDKAVGVEKRTGTVTILVYVSQKTFKKKTIFNFLGPSCKRH